ncbi:hypothetical protein PGTUg99_033017 [Puccinia graminis f. sp. tritici]|uniref:Uncharacterized protein n=1 Tax=Puccinia graminis f. sp. tritici TaxID=56615 RepID=A0A5B0RNF6_PUCGR|nr:hypothetical protein PGTUg99_033017 [Puccinia graminis f. sp. tritici]
MTGFDRSSMGETPPSMTGQNRSSMGETPPSRTGFNRSLMENSSRSICSATPQATGDYKRPFQTL